MNRPGKGHYPDDGEHLMKTIKRLAAFLLAAAVLCLSGCKLYPDLDIRLISPDIMWSL